MAAELTQPTVEFLILADRAEAVNGKLYMLGGGWDRLTLADFSKPASFTLAIGVLVPWSGANLEHKLTVYLEHEDGRRLTQIDGAVNVGRPAEAVPGQSFRAMFAIHVLWTLPGPGTYRVVSALGEGDSKSVALHAQASQR